MKNYLTINNWFLISNLFFFIFLFGFHNRGFTQISVDSYVGVGQTLVSEGAYSELSTLVFGKYAGFNAATGGLISLMNTQQNLFTAYSLAFSKDFSIAHHNFNIGTFYLWKPFSDNLRETNIGMLADFKTRHFAYAVGLNSRTYSFTNAAKQKFNLTKSINTTITEPLNLMYKVSYFKPFNHLFLFEGSVKNYDRYIVLQETNPMLFAKFSCGINYKLQLYSELCYMQSGFFNVHVSYFGFSIRGGVLWQIN